MFAPEINRKTEQMVIAAVPRLEGSEAIRELIIPALQHRFARCNAHKITPLPCLPASIATAGFREYQELAYRLGVLWTFYIEYVELLDAVQDKEAGNIYLRTAGEAQALNVAFILNLNLPLIIHALPVQEEKKQELSRLLSSCSLRMFQGQSLDIKYTGYKDGEADYHRTALLKAGPAYKAVLRSFFIASGEEEAKHCHPDFMRWTEEFAAFNSIYSDYCDIWLHDHSKDLQDLKLTMPLASALEDPLWGEQTLQFMAGSNRQPEKQMALRRWLCRTRAVEAFAEYIRKFKEGVPWEKLPRFLSLTTSTRKIIADAEEMLESLEEVRAHCSTDTLPEPDFSASLKKGRAYLDSFSAAPRLALPGDRYYLHYRFREETEAGRFLRHWVTEYMDQREYDDETGEEGEDSILTAVGEMLSLAGKYRSGPGEETWAAVLDPILKRLDTGKTQRPWTRVATFLRGLAEYHSGKYAETVTRLTSELLSSCNRQLLSSRYPSTSTLQEFYGLATLLSRQQQSHPVLEQDWQALFTFQKLDGSWNNSTRTTAMILEICLDRTTMPEPSILRGLRYLEAMQAADGRWYEQDSPCLEPGSQQALNAHCLVVLEKWLAVCGHKCRGK